ncbi:MAG TPA: hypothetical protein VM617_04940 [Thermoanaerobaculia bacterium]|nr:hypothetical protein [Thermoanaerobaculia bacterium]
MSRSRRLPPRRFLWPLALAAVWLLFAYLVAPFLIAGLYHGALTIDHDDLAAEIAESRAEAPLAVHLGEWRWFALWPAVAAVAWCLFAIAFADPGRRRRLLGATPTSLAGLRIAVCGTALLVVAREHLPSLADLPAALAGEMGLFELVRWMPGSERLMAGAAGLGVLQGATVLLLGLALVGWRTRWTLPAAALAYFVVGGALRSYSRFFHAGLTPLYLLVVLAFAPCGDAMSLDRRRRLRRGEPVPEAERPRAIDATSRFAVWTVMALVYFESGLSKLRAGGLLWWHPDNLRTIVYRDSLAPMAFDFDLGLAAAAAPDLVFAAAGLAALAVELFYPAVLFSSRARIGLPAAAAGLHVGILFVQNVAFFDLVLLQALFYDWRRWLPAALRSRRQVATVTVPDGDPTGWARRIAVVFLVAWAFRLELYPLSAMQMYADRETSGEVEYLRVTAERRSGRETPAPLEEAIPALADSRYRWLLDDFLEGSRRERRLGAGYLAAAARAYNRRVPEEVEIVAFEVEKYRWNFVASPQQAVEPIPGERLTGRRVEVGVGER